MGFFDTFISTPDSMVSPEDALTGRQSPVLHPIPPHAVLGTSLTGPWEQGSRVIYLAMGCFWGAEELFWQQPGVISTAVGYMGGTTPHPTYEEVCTGRTGHTETALVAYNPQLISEIALLTIFWEHHDPTTGFRQGNDIGTQYRSAVYWTTPEQRTVVHETLRVYGSTLADAGYDAITTECRPAIEAGPFYAAEEYHQQYLAKNPNGYRCHATTGIPYPVNA